MQLCFGILPCVSPRMVWILFTGLVLPGLILWAITTSLVIYLMRRSEKGNVSKFRFKPEDFEEPEFSVIQGITSAASKHIAMKANSILDAHLRKLRDDLMCFSTGASVLSEDLIKEWFDGLD